MSTKTLGDYKKPPHRRNDSDELDVFEASRYFSEYNDKIALEGAHHEEMVSKQVRQGYLRQGRSSLDLPTLKHHQKQYNYYKQYPQNYTITTQIEQKNLQIPKHKQEKPQIIDKKKHKQPNSPGGKLANFLNTLFNQTILNNKKKKTPKSTQSMKGEEESPGSRKVRRSSMSHIRSLSSVVIDSRSLYTSSSSSGYRTPPPYPTIDTPTETCRTFSDYKQVLANLSTYKLHENSHANVKNVKNEEKRREIMKNLVEEIDEGGESDSSSDLFELQIDNYSESDRIRSDRSHKSNNYEFEFSTSGLPVYETTHLDKIKNTSSTPIITNNNGLIKV